MESVLYQRIRTLCAKRGMKISNLESELNFGNGSIKKWEVSSSPSADKLMKIANYFDTSIDYLMGRTDIECSISDALLDVLGDEDIILLQRAREKMSEKDRDKMMKMLKLGFEYAFETQEDNSDQ